MRGLRVARLSVPGNSGGSPLRVRSLDACRFTRLCALTPNERTIFERLISIPARFGRADALADYADEEPPLRSELFSADQMEEHGKRPRGSRIRLPAGHARDRLLGAAGRERAHPARGLRPARPRRSRRTAGSRRPRSGCSTISTSSRSRSARRSGTCPRATAASFRASRAGRPRDFRASTTSRSRRSRTATAASTRRACPASWPPTRPWRR